MISSLLKFLTPQKKAKTTLVSKEEALERRKKFEQFVNDLQNHFVQTLQKYETKAVFLRDEWQRQDGHGGGITCVLQDGNFFEKAGVNTSKMSFPFNQGIAQSMKERGKVFTDDEIKRYNIYANGISLVIHPINPFVPTVHANYRWMELYDRETNQTIDCWFGGGGDLTPHYLFEEDCKEFHQGFKNACDPYGQDLYKKLKKECDDYFFIKFRNERRGIGGIFYDDFLIEDSWDKTFEFAQKAGWATLNSYNTILERRKDMKYNEKNMEWKQIRRGRYVEFNLVYDRGTKFGLFTPDARIESILMSLPHVAKWEYMYKIEEGSEEEKMQKVILNPVDWI
ncbi:hypothetical protein ABPG72_019382 [Tetrahymena utriculariae]